MGNQQIMKSAYIWSLVVAVALGLLAVGGKAGIRSFDQNSNQNSNSNTGTRNTNMSQNRNANRSSNRNSGDTNSMSTHANMGALNSHDRDFVMDAAMDGLMEVELGNVAVQRGTSDAVKQFGQRMVDDHSKANTELMTLASSKGITLPTALDEKHRAQVTKLSAMSGAEFDRAYSKRMLSNHEKDVSEFEKESTRNGSDADLKAFASKTLPTLREHLQMARALPGNERSANSNRGSAKNSNSNRNSNSNSNSNRP